MLITRIDRHLRNTGMTPSRFGRAAVGDPNLVRQLRAGRQLRLSTLQRLAAYLEQQEKAHERLV